MAEQMANDERRSHWRAVIAAWQDSGQTKAAYCRENGLSIWQFHYWARRFREEAAGDPRFCCELAS